MKFRFVEADLVKGLSSRVDADDELLVNDPALRLTAVITRNYDQYLVDGDKGAAVGSLLLRNIVGPPVPGSTLEERIDYLTEGFRETRVQKVGTGPLLIFVGEGDGDFHFSEPLETDSFITTLHGGGDSVGIKSLFVPGVTSVLASLVMNAESVIGVERLSQSITYFTAEGKPIYPKSVGGSADAHLSRPLTDEQKDLIRSTYFDLSLLHESALVARLIVTSYEAERDKLRSFRAAWIALEILIKHAFLICEPYAGRGYPG